MSRHDTKRLHLGLDENGLGPRLGPLLVTAVGAELHDAAALSPLPAEPTVAALLGDSKALSSFADSSLGEAWWRVLLEQEGLAAHTVAEALELLLHEPEAHRAPCPSEPHRQQCWGTEGEAFEASEALLERCREALRWLQGRGVRLRVARSLSLCTATLNAEQTRGRSRLQQDLHAMETLVLALAEGQRCGGQRAAAGEVDAVLGKVGGYMFYRKVFGPLGAHPITTLREERALSSYRVAGVGTLHFAMDADGSHVLVALASLIGKWARDLVVRRILRHHQAFCAEPLPWASGYYDKVTAQFVERSALSRRQRDFPDTCFERARVAKG